MVCAVTGASGYVGSILATALSRKFRVVPITRRAATPDSIQWNLAHPSDISSELREQRVTTLVHAAWDFSHHDAVRNEQCNVEGSRKLFESALSAGVQRIVFISTISAFDGARSNYGQSKLEIERMVLDLPNGVVVRPGLVWGHSPGGMFGALNKQVDGGRFIPLIGSGRYPQYLVHQDDLGEAVLQAASNEWQSKVPVTVANSKPWQLRELIQSIAARKGKQITFVPLPWRAIHAALKTAETAGVKLAFRSDSVLSLVYQDPSPDFGPADRLLLTRRPFTQASPS